MNRRVVTAADVARAAHVHPSTVSRSLDPAKSHTVKPETRDRVVEAAGAMGYHPDLTASSLRRRQSKTIGVLISSFGNPIYGELLHGISNELEELGYDVLIAEVPDDARGTRMASAIRMLRSRRIDGLICAAARGSDADLLRDVSDGGLPVVLSLRWLASAGLPRVVNDDALGGALAAQHLLDLGHRAIVEIAGPLDISTFAERARGFAEVIDAAESHVSRSFVTAASPTVEDGFQLMSELLASGHPFESTALFAHNDLLAIGAMDALAEAGIDCPRRISVVGYNDNPLTGHLKPALTTIRLQIDRIGREAARLVVRLIRDDDGGDREIAIAPDLVVRESSAPASSHATVAVAAAGGALRRP